MIEVGVRGRLPLEEVSRRGNARYKELREQVEAEHWNLYIAIDAETGDYAIAKQWFERSYKLELSERNTIAPRYLSIIERKLKETEASK